MGFQGRAGMRKGRPPGRPFFQLLHIEQGELDLVGAHLS